MSTPTDTLSAEYVANDFRLTTTSRKMIVSTISRMSSAISLGVFWRLAPSTSEIMRSRNVFPGSEVIRTTILSERTFVPPVTALRSPPLSRMTGADSPVMADSSTEAIPSMTSPSPGMISFASATTTSPLRSSEAGTTSIPPSALTRLAIVSVFMVRSASAWALPRPSAIASAKLANSTVNHSHSAIPVRKAVSGPPVAIDWMA